MNWDNYARLFQDTLYIRAYLTSISNAAIATVFCLLIGYPMALGLARVSRAWRNILLMLVILPFWTSFLLRVYAWMGLLGTQQLVQQMLTSWCTTRVVPEAMALRFDPDDEHRTSPSCSSSSIPTCRS